MHHGKEHSTRYQNFSPHTDRRDLTPTARQGTLHSSDIRPSPRTVRRLCQLPEITLRREVLRPSESITEDSRKPRRPPIPASKLSIIMASTSVPTLPSQLAMTPIPSREIANAPVVGTTPPTVTRNAPRLSAHVAVHYHRIK